MSFLEGKRVLVTGGAGSLGFHLAKQLMGSGVQSVRIFDSDEYGLFLMKKEFEGEDPLRKLRFLLGDIRDRDRMAFALDGIDYVIHAAAAKNIEITEYNVPEAVRVNVTGTINLVETAMTSSDVEKFLFVSSDKSIHFSTLYGATKFIGEQLMRWAGQVSEKAWSSIRMGNFLESRGNVLDTWERQNSSKQVLTLTSANMKRYFIKTSDAARLAIRALDMMEGRETFVPKMKLYSVFEMMKEIYPGAAWKETGIRKGEKMEEELMTPEEAKVAEEQEELWILRGE